MKKMFSILSCMAFASAAYAFDCFDACGCDFHPYVGIAGGVAVPTGHYRALLPATGDADHAHFGNTNGLIGGVAGVQTGFGSNWFAAAQFNFLYDTADFSPRRSTDDTGALNHVHLKNSFQWGFDVRLGWSLCNVSPYVLGGFEAARWTISLRNDSAISALGIPANSSLHFHKTLYGPKVGGGVTFPICGCLSANMEYSYTWFGHFRRTLTDDLGFEWQHRKHIHQNTVLFGINYLF